MGDSNDEKNLARDGELTPDGTPDTTRRDALARCIAARLSALSEDELRVIDVITSRIIGIGRDSYAPLVIARDRRDWGREAAEEMADALFYLAARHVAATDARLERLHCEAADELARTNPVQHGLNELREATPVDTRLKAALIGEDVG